MKEGFLAFGGNLRIKHFNHALYCCLLLKPIPCDLQTVARASHISHVTLRKTNAFPGRLSALGCKTLLHYVLRKKCNSSSLLLNSQHYTTGNFD